MALDQEQKLSKAEREQSDPNEIVFLFYKNATIPPREVDLFGRQYSPPGDLGAGVAAPRAGSVRLPPHPPGLLPHVSGAALVAASRAYGSTMKILSPS